MENVDILFIDAAASKPYDWNSLENDQLGGTEQSTIRLVEGLGSKGHSVAVIQKYDFPRRCSPNGVLYSGPQWVSKYKPINVVWVRARGVWGTYPEARKFLWLHDACKPDHNNMSTWVPCIKENNVTPICVSNWHVQNVESIAPGMCAKMLYSPVDISCYAERASKVDANQLVWLSSPHKGLADALKVFRKLRKCNPSFKLAVFNPGYYSEDNGRHDNVVFIKGASKQTVRNVVKQSLCLFYPTRFEETFGLVAAESNALRTPVACYKIAALAESSVGPFAESEDQLINQILSWQAGNRPVVCGQDRFKFDEVYKQWRLLLNLN